MAKTISTIAERKIAAEDDIINLKVKVKVGKFLSLHGTHPTLDRSTTLRDVADEPRNDNVHFSARYYALALGKVGGDHVVGIIGG